MSPKDVKTQVVLDSIDHITTDAVSESATSMIEPGSILMVVRSGILARTVPIAVAGRPLAINQDLKALCPNASIDPWFLYYLLEAKQHELLSLVSRGATVHRLTTDRVRTIGFFLPPLSEQRRIVALLDETFEGIATAKANAEKNLQNARELFESHLDAILSRHDEGYVETCLGAEVDLLSGFAFPSAGYTGAPEGVRLLRGDNIMQGYLRWDEAKHWPVADQATYARFALQEGDVVLAMDRPWVKAGLKRAQISSHDAPCLLVQRTARLRARKTLRNDFLFHLTGSQAFSRHLLAVQTGLGVPHISGKQIESFRFMRPPLKEQEAIAELLHQMRQSCIRLAGIYEAKLAALEELKQSLLHQAFSGAL